MANGYQPGQIMMAMQARKEQQGQNFLAGLLAQGTNAGGQFDIVNGKPMYDAGMGMPQKSELWNQFLAVKGGRVTAQDIQSFESHWQQAEFAKTQKQMSELGKLRLKGFSDKEIRSSVKQSPVLYENLLDMITDLEASGDENLYGQAAAMKQFLPEQETRGAVGEILEEPGLGTRLGLPIAAAATIYGAQKLARRSPEAIKAAKKKYKSDISKVRDKVTSNRESVKSNKAELKKEVSKKRKTVKVKENIKDLRKQNRILTKETKDLVQKGKDIKYKVPSRGYQDLAKRFKGGGLPGAILGGATLAQLPAAGEALFGEEKGRGYGETAQELGLLGWGMAGLRGIPAAGPVGGVLKAIGYSPMAYYGGKRLLEKGSEMYSKYYGDEE